LGIATNYRLDGPGSNAGGSEIFRTLGPLSLLYNRYRVFPGSKERPGRDADPSPPSSALVKKEWCYTSTPRMGRTACTRVHFTFHYLQPQKMTTVTLQMPSNSSYTLFKNYRTMTAGTSKIGIAAKRKIATL